ncbi:HlyD family type I secretion periplasmic adaptor subunit [Photobacterium satsumensis]|uniref:HlyD family type I secretion periplasmic adaptor subunit n=1 Tax=Photobacterium satsumensis TaxID=2910239 RepID=UPI003D11EF7F
MKPIIDKEVLSIAPKWEQLRHQQPNMSLYIGLWTILLSVAGLILWACISEVDTYVAARGHVKPIMRNTVLESHAEGKLIEYTGRVGDQVLAGELIAVLDGRISKSDVNATKYQLQSVEARIKRLEAELQGGAFADYAIESAQYSLEAALFLSRQAAHQATVEARLQQISSIKLRLESLASEKDIIAEQLKLYSQLVKDKKARYEKEREAFRRNGPRKEEYMNAMAQLLELSRKDASITSSMMELKTEGENLKKELDRYQSQRKVEISDELVLATREYITLRQKLVVYEEKEKLVEIRSPFDAIIFRVADTAIGTHITPDEFLYELVPTNSPMEVVVDLNPADINQISLGDAVTIKLDSLPFTKFGTITGRLRQVSEDTFNDDVNGEKTIAFRGWIDIKSMASLRALPTDFRLQPGLTLEANIQTDKRTLISYLIYPIAKAFDESFREP